MLFESLTNAKKAEIVAEVLPGFESDFYRILLLLKIDPENFVLSDLDLVQYSEDELSVKRDIENAKELYAVIEKMHAILNSAE